MSYAEHEGLYKQAGLNVKVEYGKGSVTTSEDVGAGRTDIGDVGSLVAITSIAQGVPIVSVGAWTAKYESGFLVPQDSAIHTIADLKGKSVVISPGTNNAKLEDAALESAGVNPSSVHNIFVSSSAAISTYARGVGDAISQSVPYAGPLLKDKRPSRGMLWSFGGVSFPNYSYVVNKAFLKAHRDAVERFLQTTYKALIAAYQHPEQAVKDFVKDNPTLPYAGSLAQFQADKSYVCSDEMIAAKQPVGYQNSKQWSQALKVLEKVKSFKIKASLSPSDVYTNEFFEGASPVSTTACSSTF